MSKAVVNDFEGFLKLFYCVFWSLSQVPKKVLPVSRAFCNFFFKKILFLPSQTETLKNHEPQWNALSKCFHAKNKKTLSMGF